MSQDSQRFSLLEKIFLKHNLILISDSMSLLDLIKIRKNQNNAFLFLELYHISFKALLTHIQHTFSLNKPKTYFYCLLCTLKFLIFMIKVSKENYIIINSLLRKNFLSKKFPKILVIKNKPIESHFKILKPISDRLTDVVISGNHGNENEILELIKKLLNLDLNIKIFGINSSLASSIKDIFPQIQIQEKLPNSKAIIELDNSKLAVVSYDNNSINQKLSSSSKLFEIYNSGAIPLVNNNSGVLHECEIEKIPYIKFTDIFNSSKLSFSQLIDKHHDHKPEYKYFDVEIEYLNRTLEKC